MTDLAREGKSEYRNEKQILILFLAEEPDGAGVFAEPVGLAVAAKGQPVDGGPFEAGEVKFLSFAALNIDIELGTGRPRYGEGFPHAPSRRATGARHTSA